MQNKLPNIIPIGWQIVTLPAQGLSPGGRVIVQETFTGLRCMFSRDPSGPDGSFEKHLSMSRPDRYPDWVEMVEVVYNSGLFDPNKPVQMILPAKNHPEQYVNQHKNCFHWWQEEG